MLCNLSKLRLKFNKTLKHKLLDYGTTLRPISNMHIVRVVESLDYEENYCHINDCHAWYLHVPKSKIFTEININRIKEIYHELFLENQSDIIDTETKTIYGMVRIDYPMPTRIYLYLIPKINNKLTDDIIETYFSENFRTEYLLNKINRLEQTIEEMRKKMLELEYAPSPIFQTAKQHFEECQQKVENKNGK